MFAIWFSFNPTIVTTQNYSFIFMMIPIGILGGIGGLLGLIGAILMIVGRKEFGEKHRKSIFYAFVIFIIAIIVMIIFVVLIGISVFMSISQTSLTTLDSNSTVDLFRNSSIMTIIPIMTPIIAVFSGLIWVFGLYQLENRTGRIVLLVGFTSMIITSIVVAINSINIFNDLLSSGILEEWAKTNSSSYSQLLSNYPWIGTTAIINIIGNSITTILFIFTLYIPYKRIK